MTYKSPLHIIEGIAFKDFEVNGPNLIRLRKQLLADLNLSGQTTIAINKKVFSKDEIIKTIDLLLNDPDLGFHEFIFANKQLLGFLENEEYFNPFSEFQKLQPPEQHKQQFILLMEERFLIQFKRAMSKRNFVYAEETLLFIKHLPEEQRDRHYEVVNRTLISLAGFIEEVMIAVKAKKNKEAEVTLRFLSDMKFSMLLNALPEDLNETINLVVNRTINFMFHYHKQKRYDRLYVSQISYMLMNVRECDGSHWDIIRNNHKVYAGLGSSGDTFIERFLSGGTDTTRMIYFALFFLITVLRMCH
jgi:hypothetical protein